MSKGDRKFLRRDYEGEQITVSFDFKRCLHVAECVRRAPQAFDKDRRPWIIPDKAGIETVVESVLACPTGALRYEMGDGSNPEQPPATNTVYVMQDGPLYVRGQVEIVGEDGTVLHRDYRVALCRCGVSENKPFCDNSHRESEFEAQGLVGSVVGKDGESGGGPLSVFPGPDGSFKLSGPFSILGAGEQVVKHADDELVKLCRCGHSAQKPYCDGSHRPAGFRAGTW